MEQQTFYFHIASSIRAYLKLKSWCKDNQLEHGVTDGFFWVATTSEKIQDICSFKIRECGFVEAYNSKGQIEATNNPNHEQEVVRP